MVWLLDRFYFSLVFFSSCFRFVLYVWVWVWAFFVFLMYRRWFVFALCVSMLYAYSSLKILYIRPYMPTVFFYPFAIFHITRMCVGIVYFGFDENHYVHLNVWFSIQWRMNNQEKNYSFFPKFNCIQKIICFLLSLSKK